MCGPCCSPLGAKKSVPGCVNDAGFFPFALENVGSFVGLRMDVRWDGDAGVKFSQHGDAAGRFVFVQDHQFDAGIWTGLPLFVFGESDVLEHAPTLKRAAQKDKLFFTLDCGAFRI